MSVAQDYPNLDRLPAPEHYAEVKDTLADEARTALLEIARLRTDLDRYRRIGAEEFERER